MPVGDLAQCDHQGLRHLVETALALHRLDDEGRHPRRIDPHPHRRAQAGADAVWPLLADVFSPTGVEQRLTAAGVAVDPASVRDEVVDVLTTVLARATLTVPEWPADTPPRGRTGAHGPELTALLADLQGLARQHPAATW